MSRHLQAPRRPDAEVAAFADVYARWVEDAQRVVPSAATYSDYRRLRYAVIVATPRHLHCQHFVDALDAGSAG